MNIGSKDLSLLLLFRVLEEERSVSKAAERLGLSQPALSHRLAKLRREMNDPLFVRKNDGLALTPTAERIAHRVCDAVARIEAIYQDIETERFLDSDDTLHIYTTDYTEYWLMPELIELLRKEAPKVRVVTHNTLGRSPTEALARGQCDLAIAGFFDDLPGSYYKQVMRREHMKIVVNRDSAMARDGADLTTYAAGRHIMTTLVGDLYGPVDRELAAQGLDRQVVAGYSSFIAPLDTVSRTDTTLICLESVARIGLRLYDNLMMLDPPFRAPVVQVAQVWHERTHMDPLRSWFRRQVFKILHRE